MLWASCSLASATVTAVHSRNISMCGGVVPSHLSCTTTSTQCSLIRKKTKSKHTLSHCFRTDVQSSQFLATPLYRLVLAPILFQNRRQHDGPNSGAASRLLRAASILGNADDTWSGMVEATSETDCAAYPRRSGS